jgi:cytochrome P450
MDPTDVLAAVTHPDPYPYYARLRERGATFHNAGLGCWVVPGATEVREALANPALHVRPAADRVPRPIQGTPAGEIFGALVRMNDGAARDQAKRAIERALEMVRAGQVTGLARRHAAALGETHGIAHAAGLATWAHAVPVHCVAGLMDIAADDDFCEDVRRFVAGFSPSIDEAQAADAGRAAAALRARVAAQLDNRRGDILQIASEGPWSGRGALEANLVGFFSQAYDATAGLIGNAIVALVRNPERHAALRADPGLMMQFVREVGESDPPVQNTRRFVASETALAGTRLRPGEMLLLLLPGFGSGPHACPGRSIAESIAAGCLEHLLTLGPAALPPGLAWTYKPSHNVRVPMFRTMEAAA